MAHVERRLLGDFSGKVGQRVFRIRGNTNILAQAPYGYTIPDTQAYRDRIARFILTTKFCSAIYKMSHIKSIWQNKFPDTNIANLLRSINYKYVVPEDVLETGRLTPDDGFGVRLDSVALDAVSLTVNLLPLTAQSLIDPAVEKTVKLGAVVVLSDPAVPDTPPTYIFPLFSENVVFNLVDPVQFNVLLSTANADMIPRYALKKVFFSIITMDAENIPVQAAKTTCSLA